MQKRIKTAEFTGPWLESFGKPELKGCWMVWGDSSSGKTSFMLRLCRYLAISHRCKVAYVSLEQGASKSLQMQWGMAGMQDCKSRVQLWEDFTYDELKEKLDDNCRPPKVVVIDSIQYLDGLNVQTMNELMRANSRKLFICVSHANGQEPNGELGKKVRFHADVKIHVEGYKAFFSSRFATEEHGNKEFVIWPEGANKYWAEKV